MQQFDVAIIGGGLIGASMARTLAGHGLKIAVIDRQQAIDLYKPALDNRGLALSCTSIKILEKLNIWSSLFEFAHPIKIVHVSEQGSFGFTKLTATNFKIPALGYVVGAGALGKVLIADLENLTGVTVLRPVEIEGLDFDLLHASWNITLNQGQIKAKLLIGADGSDSFVRQSLNIPITSIDYQQSAVVTNLIINQKHQDVAYERFTKSGVLALLPFGEKKLKCVWTLNNSAVADFMQLNDQEFLSNMQQAFGFRVGKFIAVDRRMVFPVQQLQAEKLYCKNAVLLGNAANTLHPVAAQGFNLGLRDVVALAKIIIAGEPLENYAASRKIDHADTQKYTNTLVDLFASEVFTVKTVRRLGLLVAQFIPALNKRITAQGAGVWMS